MNGQRINRSGALCAFLPVQQLGRTVLCSWLKIRLRHGHHSCSGHFRDGGLFKSPCLLPSSDTFLWPLSIAQQPHLSIRDLQAWRRFYQTPRPSFLSLAPHSTSSYPSCCQNVPHPVFSHGLFLPTQGSIWSASPSSASTTICCHTDILNPKHLPGSSTVLSFEPLQSPTYWSPHSLTLCSTISSCYDMLIRCLFFRSAPYLSFSPLYPFLGWSDLSCHPVLPLPHINATEF